MTVPSRTEAHVRSGEQTLIDWITAGEDPEPRVSGLVVDFWWLAHDELGAPRLGASATGGAMGLGLGAALLGGLALTGRLRLDRAGAPLVVGEQPRDPLASHVFAQIDNSAPHGLQEWLSALAVDAHARVAARLEADGLVEPVELRHRRRVVVHYPPTHHLSAVQPSVLLSRRLARRESMGEYDALLVAIAVATGLRPLLVDGGGRAVARHARLVMEGLRGPAQDIALATRTAQSRAVVTYRS